MEAYLEARMERTALAHLRKSMDGYSTKMITQCFIGWKDAWLERKKKEWDLQLASNMELSAINHLKSKLAAAAGKGLAACFTEWKTITLEACMTAKMNASLHQGAIMLLQRTFKQIEGNTFTATFKQWVVWVQEEKQMRLEDNILRKMDLQAMQFLKAKITEKRTKVQ